MASPSPQQLEKHIRRSALDTANVLFRLHAKQRMRQRHVTPAMVYEALQKGKLTATPEPDPRYQGLRCRMQRFVAGVDLAVVVYVDMPKPDLVVITVFSVEGA
jgi:hypothetical protein